MKYTAAEIASYVGGEVVGNPAAVATNLARIEEAGHGSLTFLHSPKYFHHLYTTQAAVVLVPRGFKPEGAIQATLVYVAAPYPAFGFFLNQASQQQQARSGRESPHFIAQSAIVGEDVYIGAFAYIDEGAKIGNAVKIYPNVYIGRNVIVGDNCTLHPNAIVYHDCVIGANCILHSGCVVGSDGFGFIQNDQHANVKVPQLGNVVLEADVEVGSNATIDRATLGSTYIRKGAKLDNLVQVAHNCDVGPNTVMAAQSGISGSSKLGRNCMVGGQVGIAGHLALAEFSQIAAKSGVSKNVTKPGTALRGVPAQPLREQLKLEANLRQVSKLIERLAELEESVQRLTNQLNQH